MKKIKLIIICISYSVLASCGGGGGDVGGDSKSASPVASVSFNANVSTINFDGDIILEWSSVNSSSCIASGDWSGVKARSGSQVVKADTVGSKTYILDCSGTSKSVSVDVYPALSTSMFINDDQVFSGYLFYKRAGYLGCLLSIEAELGIHDQTNLYFKSFSSLEARHVGLFPDEDGNYDQLGFRLGPNGNGSSNYSWSISSADYYPTNKIELNTSKLFEPSDFPNSEPTERELLAVVEKFNANINLEFDRGEGVVGSCFEQDIEMSVLAIPGKENGSMFLGSSNNLDSYTVLYLQDKRLENSNASNLTQESDIFKTWEAMDIYTSYLSEPNVSINDNFLRVDSYGANYPSASDSQRTILSGSKQAHVVNANNVNLSFYPAAAIKYLYIPDVSSKQRVFSLHATSSECSMGSVDFPRTGCTVSDPYIMFMTHDKANAIGFSVGGDATNVTLFSEIWWE